MLAQNRHGLFIAINSIDEPYDPVDKYQQPNDQIYKRNKCPDNACEPKPQGLSYMVASKFSLVIAVHHQSNNEPYDSDMGNDGYILMSQKNNNCGVATAATYVII